MEGSKKLKTVRLPAALAYGLIRRGCSPADLAAHAMLWPRGGHVPQQFYLPPGRVATELFIGTAHALHRRGPQVGKPGSGKGHESRSTSTESNV